MNKVTKRSANRQRRVRKLIPFQKLLFLLPLLYGLFFEKKSFFCGRIHLVKFPPGTLDKHYEKLLQCDDHLWELSQSPFPSLNSPYFSSPNSPYFCSSNRDGVSEIPFDFTSCNSPFPLPTIPPSLVPPHQTQNFKLSTGQPFDIVNSESPMSGM